jgi:uncharacterized protein GlcG (DUF336 family)
MRKTFALAAVAAAIALAAPLPAAAQSTFSTRQLTPEAALKVAQAALEQCRKGGYQIAVAVVDRAGVAQVMLRDRFAGAHTPDTARAKAWTAASFRADTVGLGKATQSGELSSGIRHIPGVVMVGGGVPIEAGGTIIGAVGVSGAPSGEADDGCARAGIKAIADDLQLGG